MCLFNLVREKYFLVWVYAIEDEGTGLCQDSPIAHFGMNIIWLKQIYWVDNWQKI